MYDEYINKSIIKEPSKWEIYGLYSEKCNPLPTKYLSSSKVLLLRDKMFSDYYQNSRIEKMIERKFGSNTLEHIQRMISNKLKRDIVIKKDHPEIIPAGGYKANNIQIENPRFEAKVV